MIEPDKFAWLIPFAVSLIPAYLALYIGLICFIVKFFDYRGFPKILFFSSSWVFAELIRSSAFTGFPWNLAGYVFMGSPELSQTGSIVGVYGLSLLAIILFSAPYLVLKSISDFKLEGKAYKLSFSIIYLLPIMALTAGLAVEGSKKLKKYENQFEKTDIRIVQPNIPQKEKFDRLRLGEQLYKFYTLTLKEPKNNGNVPDVIIWPEAATPFNIKTSARFRDEASNIIPLSSYLILGSVRFEGNGDNIKAFNSMEVLDSEGNLIEEKTYDKHHLVPFGEYIPLRKFFPNLDKITHGMGDFSTGKGTSTISIKNEIPPYSPSICYEIIFPQYAIEKKEKFEDEAKWIINTTNDGWFGNSSGPYQHLDIARMRAIENGVPVIRSANTGISAVISANGLLLDFIPLNEEGIIDAKLPKALDYQTPYRKNGDKDIILLCGFMMVFSAILKLSLKLKKT
jgi:apolipoprotein N-acyltransferase